MNSTIDRDPGSATPTRRLWDGVTRWLALAAVLSASGLAAAGCAGGAAPAVEGCEGEGCAPDDLDVGGEPEGEPEVVEPEATPEPAPEPEPEPVTDGGFGFPCDRNDDCVADVCIDTRSQGRICTDFCLEDAHCPDGFYCGTYINVEAVSVCLEVDASLCDPCREDFQCGGASDLCLDTLDGRFCGRDCAPPQQPCPEGFDCVPIRDDQDVVISQQCQPASRFCTECLDIDGDGHGAGGGCLGADCDEDDRDNHEGAQEICDEIDNDCDDLIDEATSLADDPQNCGECGRLCAPANAEAACLQGQCQIARCAEGFYDINQDPADGCEYACAFVDELDEPDTLLVDTNCDGIDGDRDGAVFVQKDIGRDDWPGTPEEPMRTLSAAMGRAAQLGLPVYVGTSATPYPGPVVMRSGVSLYGGFDFDRGLGRRTSAVTRIEGGEIAVHAQGISIRTVLLGFEIRSSDAAIPGRSSYGVWVRDSAALEIRGNTIVSGNGAAGVSGAGGLPGASAQGGLNGEEGCEEVCFVGECNPRGGAGGPGIGVCANGLPSGNGGAGGQGGFESDSGDRGQNGTGAQGGPGGQGGPEGRAGQPGSLGGQGLAGLDGAGGDGGVVSVDGLWIPSDGAAGSGGANGSGGGGGGGGGGAEVNCFSHSPDGGGGGGGGGGSVWIARERSENSAEIWACACCERRSSLWHTRW